MHGDFGDGAEAGFLHGLEQQIVSLLPGLFRHHEVRRVEVDGIDALRLHEFQNLHVVAGGGRDTLYLFVVHDDEAILLHFEPFYQFAALHYAIAMGTEGLLFNAAVANAVNLIEADALGPRGRKQTHRYGDETESDVAFPNRGCHMVFLLSACSIRMKRLRFRAVSKTISRQAVWSNLGGTCAL